MSFWSQLFGISKSRDFRRGESAKFKDSLRALRNLPPFFRMVWETNRWMTLGNIFLRIVQALIPITQLYIGKLIIDEVIGYAKLGGSQEMDSLWLWVGLEFGLALLSDLLARGINLLDALLGDLFANESSLRLMRHAASLDLPQFEDSTFYDKLERARRQTTGRVVLLSQILAQFQDILTIIFLAGGLAVFNPWLILLLALAVIPAFLNDTWFNNKNYSLARSWTAERRELDYLRFIGASDETAKEVKVFGLADFLTQRFSKVATEYYLANRNLAMRRAFWGGVFNVLGVAAYYGAYVLIILQTVAGILSIGDLTFLSGSFMRLRQLLQSLLGRFSSIAQSALYLQDFFDFLEMEPLIVSPKSPLPLPPFAQMDFRFEKVGFRYPNSEVWAVRNLSFHLKAGEKLALVGENGAGKTTLVKLIARLYAPNEGRILLNEQDIGDYDPQELRQAIGVIFQDYVRFQMDASDNIAVGRIEARESREEIQLAAVQSLADPVIQDLPLGYQQMLGRRFKKGTELSGGQWQKVALARAYMRDASVLILDEPTASLDARAEYEVFQRFAELTEGKTAILISHRFSTVRMANRILVLKKGELQEIGSHEELLAKKGLYAELFNLQAQGYK